MLEVIRIGLRSRDLVRLESSGYLKAVWRFFFECYVHGLSIGLRGRELLELSLWLIREGSLPLSSSSYLRVGRSLST